MQFVFFYSYGHHHFNSNNLIVTQIYNFFHQNPAKSPSDFSGRNKCWRRNGTQHSSQQTAMPTVTRVVSILNFTTFQNGDTTFYRQISRKHRFQRLCRYILSDFQGFIRILSIRRYTTSNLPFVRHCKPNKRSC